MNHNFIILIKKKSLNKNIKSERKNLMKKKKKIY
jgi:hypothetical protein